jgi:intracellular sulfur oxidation DsrE/DsrF family protein
LLEPSVHDFLEDTNVISEDYQISARRRFIARAAAAVATLTGLPRIAGASDFAAAADEHEHDAWMKAIKAKHRQLFHAMDLNDRAMLLASNYLDAYRDAFGAKPGEAAAVIGVHGGALALGFTDSAWAKYGFAKASGLLDPTTKEVAARNIYGAGVPLSVDTLQKRGVVFLMCNTALRLTSQALAKARGETAEAVYEDLKASRVPGTILVPAMVVAINRAEEAGFSYVRV